MLHEQQLPSLEGKIHFLVDEIKAHSVLTKILGKKGKKSLEFLNDPYYSAWFLRPYVETELCISETVNLEYKVVSGKIKLEESVSTARKDRYSSISYGNYLASLFDSKLLKQEKDSFDWKEYIYFGKDSFQ